MADSDAQFIESLQSAPAVMVYDQDPIQTGRLSAAHENPGTTPKSGLAALPSESGAQLLYHSWAFIVYGVCSACGGEIRGLAADHHMPVVICSKCGYRYELSLATTGAPSTEYHDHESASQG